MAAEAMKFQVDGCPDLEVIAAYLDRRLAERERIAVADHLAGCEGCYFVFSEAAQIKPTVVTPMPVQRWWTRPHVVWPTAAAGLAAAATLVLAVSGVLPWGRSDGPELEGLVAAVGTERTFEPRLTGGFAYGPLRTVRAGGPGDPNVSPDVRIAAALVEKEAASQQTPGALRARAIASLIMGDVDRSVAALEQAAERQGDDPRILSDLGAAYLVRAERNNQPEDLSKAVASLNRALTAEHLLVEALFNRAYALQQLSLKEEARDAWRTYLRIDDQSGWAEEARTHLRTLDDQP